MQFRIELLETYLEFVLVKGLLEQDFQFMDSSLSQRVILCGKLV